MTIQRPELPEKDFIQEGYSKNPFPFWLWLFLLAVVIVLAWGGTRWYSGKIDFIFSNSPFLQVTNRQLSLFLWQNPEFMRVNAKQKGGYLTGFQYAENVTMELASADQYAVAPPDLLFRYHTWNRLISAELTQRSIPRDEFREFLSAAPEWMPTYWPEAPAEYNKMIKDLGSSRVEDLATLPEATLPLSVRIAFQGWKNYFKEGEAIDGVKPTYAEVEKFISSHPHYARNYWRNIVDTLTLHYLKNMNDREKSGVVPSNEMAPFLKVAIYNYLESVKKA